jgi:hypothetical protein
MTKKEYKAHLERINRIHAAEAALRERGYEVDKIVGKENEFVVVNFNTTEGPGRFCGSALLMFAGAVKERK